MRRMNLSKFGDTVHDRPTKVDELLGSHLMASLDKLDVVAGLAIHEKLHLVHSKPLMKYLRDNKPKIMDLFRTF